MTFAKACDVLSLGESRMAWRFFHESVSVEVIAERLGKSVRSVREATVEREEVAVSMYRATRNLAKVAKAICARRTTVVEILARHGITHVVAHGGKGAPRSTQFNREATLIVDEPAPEGAQSFAELGDDGCRYPYGVTPPYLFCGALVGAVERGGLPFADTYCAHHRGLCSRAVAGSRDAR